MKSFLLGFRRGYILGHLTIALALAIVLLICAIRVVGAQERVWTAEDTLRALDGAPAVVICIVDRETGGTFDPYSVGRAGEQGVAQLLPSWNGGGQWAEFHYGYEWTSMPPELRTPFNPFQSVSYLEFWGRRSGGTYWPWTTYRLCQ